MKLFWEDRTGSAPILAAFLIIVLITLSAAVYAGVTVYAQYQACETELQRAATVTVDTKLDNAHVRDLLLDVPDKSAEEYFYASLTEAGWTLEDGSCNRYEDGRRVYGIEDVAMNIEGKTMAVSAITVIPLPWGGMGDVHIPLTVRTSVLYIE